jgi:D-sedoheptulose 7-phosphate isomerase
MTIAGYMLESARLLSVCAEHPGVARIDLAVELLIEALRSEAPILVCGNGGSAADAIHITGELVGRFLRQRRAFNCICLSSNPAVLTACANDDGFETVFSRQVEAHGRPGGVLLGISTSGNSPNMIKAFESARNCAMSTIALTGRGGGRLAALADVLVDVPSSSTPMIQQAHACLYHYMCERVEATLAGPPQSVGQEPL